MQYFKCSVTDGHLRVNEPLVYWTDRQLDSFPQMTTMEPKVHNVEELEAALRIDRRPLTLWIVEGMEEEARRRARC